MALNEYVYRAVAVVYGSVTLAYLSVWSLLDLGSWRPKTWERTEELEKGKSGPESPLLNLVRMHFAVL